MSHSVWGLTGSVATRVESICPLVPFQVGFCPFSCQVRLSSGGSALSIRGPSVLWSLFVHDSVHVPFQLEQTVFRFLSGQVQLSSGLPLGQTVHGCFSG